MYDVSCNGTLSEDEIFQVMKMLVGNGLTDKQLRVISQKVLAECDLNQDGTVDQEEFINVIISSFSDISEWRILTSKIGI